MVEECWAVSAQSLLSQYYSFSWYNTIHNSDQFLFKNVVKCLRFIHINVPVLLNQIKSIWSFFNYCSDPYLCHYNPIWKHCIQCCKTCYNSKFEKHYSIWAGCHKSFIRKQLWSTYIGKPFVDLKSSFSLLSRCIHNFW